MDVDCNKMAAHSNTVEEDTLGPGLPLAVREVKSFCRICHTEFTSNKVFKQHLDAHIALAQVRCLLCDCAFADFESLGTHLQKRHSSSGEKFCQICHIKFASDRECMQHLDAHAAHLSVGCLLCDDAFVDFESLGTHMKSHPSSGYADMASKECSLQDQESRDKTSEKVVNESVSTPQSSSASIMHTDGQTESDMALVDVLGNFGAREMGSGSYPIHPGGAQPYTSKEMLKRNTHRLDKCGRRQQQKKRNTNQKKVKKKAVSLRKSQKGGISRE